MSNAQEWIPAGQVTSVYGVRGWVKVYSNTDPITNIFEYQPWVLAAPDADPERLAGLAPVEVTDWKPHGKGLIAQLDHCHDRELARQYCQQTIYIRKSLLAELPEGDYYWRQLTGLKVVTTEGVSLGKVTRLMETGSNDVLVVKGQGHRKTSAVPEKTSDLDRRERLIPWLPGQVVQEVDLDAGTIRVDWDPEF